MSLSAADLHTVYSFLSNALSIDESTRKQAESALAQCENRPGFCTCLLEIIAARDSGCRDDALLLASVYFKNSISRYWRHRRDTSFAGHESNLYELLFQQLCPESYASYLYPSLLNIPSALFRESDFQPYIVLHVKLELFILNMSSLLWLVGGLHFLKALSITGTGPCDNGIRNGEKNHIQTKLLLHLREENTQIAIQLAVLVAKIARIDYPKE
ncbi:hypothetical protein ZIOFF_060055 [Zingiber officinale]|uniref:Importin N-terminal domain-containing protein n=1 Tax=Zingiber officinale TaxID=94328 RepID=A0A8J5FG49_ZINOF|nr:hypothetical protein ZIOFF_060055 [Zingiber officinale]